ncbi:hypothetical protein OBBRIDRAFT_422859 [Obba rivulosa]|uniref:Uncharacterized protein n=1 Tax=Obba rivulosa TaxID=1052685 RepID=A0A8E2B4X3_9APHY|nr:hypothetical protein OBBRIDRAFT_422859 [Obba rivulosa]
MVISARGCPSNWLAAHTTATPPVNLTAPNHSELLLHHLVRNIFPLSTGERMIALFLFSCCLLSEASVQLSQGAGRMLLRNGHVCTRVSVPVSFWHANFVLMCAPRNHSSIIGRLLRSTAVRCANLAPQRICPRQLYCHRRFGRCRTVRHMTTEFLWRTFIERRRSILRRCHLSRLHAPRAYKICCDSDRLVSHCSV